MSPAKDAVRLGAELLAVRDYSEKEMTERLTRRGYSPEESRAAAARLVELGLIKIAGNDREALRIAAREYLLKKGKELKPSTLSSLAAFLVRKGFDEELIEEYLSEAAEVMRDPERE